MRPARQVDDTNTFAAPLLRDFSVPATPLSMAAVNSLPPVRVFWRVRGVNTAGTPGAWSAVRSFTPQTAPVSTLSTMSTNPSTVIGGNLSSATVVMSVGAPDGGAVIALTSSHPAIATVPAMSTVPTAQFTTTFQIATTAVSATTVVTITATYNGATRTATLTVTPAGGDPNPPPPPDPPPPPPPPQAATLTVTATGRSNVRITSSPSGIAVMTGSSGSASFTVGAQITLTASDSRDAIWSGACSSNGSKRKTCAFTLNANASVTANVQ
jgi:hypothetical protein